MCHEGQHKEGGKFIKGRSKKGEGKTEANGDARRRRGDDGGDVATLGDVAMTKKVTLAQLSQEKKTLNGQLCGDLNKYLFHRSNIETVGHDLTCQFCGKTCHTQCKICDVAAHDNPVRGKYIGYQCFTHLHNDQSFGLGLLDCKLVGTNKKKWKEPTNNDKETNSRHITEIQRKIPFGLRGHARTVEEDSS